MFVQPYIELVKQRTRSKHEIVIARNVFTEMGFVEHRKVKIAGNQDPRWKAGYAYLLWERMEVGKRG